MALVFGEVGNVFENFENETKEKESNRYEVDTTAMSSRGAKPILAVQFGVLSPDEIRRFSVTQEAIIGGKRIPAGITQTTLKDHPGNPLPGGLLDERMGDPRFTPGYFGHIELTRPVYHLNYIDTVVSILRTISYYTSEPIIEEDLLKDKLKYLTGKARLKAAENMCKTKRVCGYTGNIQPKI